MLVANWRNIAITPLDRIVSENACLQQFGFGTGKSLGYLFCPRVGNRRIGPRIDTLDLFCVALFDSTASQFHARG